MAHISSQKTSVLYTAFSSFVCGHDWQTSHKGDISCSTSNMPVKLKRKSICRSLDKVINFSPRGWKQNSLCGQGSYTAIVVCPLSWTEAWIACFCHVYCFREMHVFLLQTDFLRGEKCRECTVSAGEFSRVKGDLQRGHPQTKLFL